MPDLVLAVYFEALRVVCSTSLPVNVSSHPTGTQPSAADAAAAAAAAAKGNNSESRWHMRYNCNTAQVSSSSSLLSLQVLESP